jgi:hypothetical protein
VSAVSSTLTLITENDVVTVTGEQPVATIGRADEADVKVGHAPTLDRLVARIAGEVFVAHGRLLIANRHSSLAYTLSIPGQRYVDIAPGAAAGPSGDECELHIEGALRYEIRIRHDATAALTALPRSGPKTLATLPDLTDRQIELLDIYAEPGLNGSGMALTHHTVAERMAISVSLVRLEINTIWNEFLRAGVPMRELNTRVGTVTDAWMRHHLSRR